MNTTRFVCCAAALVALAGCSGAAFSQAFCKNHYILDYPCGIQAGTPPTTIDIPPVPPGVKHWTPIGPDGTNVVALVIDPVAPATAFAGTTGSGVLKTTDAGATWASANTGLLTSNVLALAIDPVAPSTLYAATDAGVFKTTDAGTTWHSASEGLGGPAQPVVAALAIDPASPDVLYAGTSTGVFKTTDGGSSWTSVNQGLAGLAARVITVDPAAPSTLYAGVDDNVDYVNYGVFKSADGGASWHKIYSTPTGEDGGAPPITALAVDPHSSSRLYAVVAFNQVLTSGDGGASWTIVSVPSGDVWSLAADSTPGTLYVGTYLGAIFKTTDAGAHWTSVSDGLGASSVKVIATSASAPAVVYAGGTNGVFRSADGAQTWAQLTLGVKQLGVYPLAVDPGAASTIYAAVGGVLMKTVDGGAHWVQSSAGLSTDLFVDRLAVDPVTPATVYAVQTTPFSGSTLIYKSTDAGAHWAPPSNAAFSPSSLRAIAIAPTQPSTLFIGVNSEGVLKSTDSASSWSLVDSGLTAVGPYVSALAVDPTSADVVYAATDPTGQPDTPAKFFKSTDGAVHWGQVPLTAAGEITAIVIDRAAPSTLYASYADFGDAGQGGVLKSADGGATWVVDSQGLPPGPVAKLVLGGGSPAALYAVTSGGVFASVDGALTWTALNAGLPDSGVLDLAVDGTGSVLRAATIVGLFEYQVTKNAASAIVPVIEYYNGESGDYFMTARPDEIAGLDGGRIAGWTRTGLRFSAYATSTDGTFPVCRFFTTAFAPMSYHFFTSFAAECAAVQADPGWVLETGAAFYIAAPAPDGSCASGSIPVYRLYHDGARGVPEHRHTISAAARGQMIAQGWVAEGLGPDGVAMCAPP